jgi:hypothetical protein
LPERKASRTAQNSPHDFRTAIDRSGLYASVILFLSGDTLENNNERKEE